MTVGDVFMKKWVTVNSNWFYVVGMIIYIIALTMLAETFKSRNIAVASTIMVIVNVVTLAIVSWLYFKEAITLLQGIGMVLAVVAVVLMEIG